MVPQDVLVLPHKGDVRVGQVHARCLVWGREERRERAEWGRIIPEHWTKALDEDKCTLLFVFVQQLSVVQTALI